MSSTPESTTETTAPPVLPIPRRSMALMAMLALASLMAGGVLRFATTADTDPDPIQQIAVSIDGLPLIGNLIVDADGGGVNVVDVANTDRAGDFEGNDSNHGGRDGQRDGRRGNDN